MEGKAGQTRHELTAKTLRSALPFCTFLPNSIEYDAAREGFWAADQAQCQPYCIVQPRSSRDVSVAVATLQSTGCPFAIKSGGHGRLAGESSISDGVLIDLKLLSRIELSKDQSVCRVGPGSVWSDVYKRLNIQGLTVVGGRAAQVGVGGFCISGGISFFSNRHGWALDNVVAFEVVLADGTIVQASQASHPELYKALRGGGANFGIVTDLTLSVHPYEGLWGGSANYSWEHGDAVVDAFLAYGKDNESNSDASEILCATNYQGQWIWHVDLCYLKSTEPDERSVVRKMLEIPTLSMNVGPGNLVDRTTDMGSHYPSGSHNGWWTFCTQVDKRIIKVFFDVWVEEMTPLLDIDGIDTSAVGNINFVSQNIVDAMSRNGGNCLGLASGGPLLVYLMEPHWTDGAQSPRVWAALQRTAKRTQEEAERLGVHHGYIYLNYANLLQDVHAGYGPESQQFLTEVSAKYDPERMFQDQRGAGWYLDGANPGALESSQRKCCGLIASTANEGAQ